MAYLAKDVTYGKSNSYTLPEEIWRMAIHFLVVCRSSERQEIERTNRSLKSLRLVSHRFERIASQQLFRHIRLYPHIKSFEIALSIANSRRLRCWVQSITYNAQFRDLTNILVFEARAPSNRRYLKVPDETLTRYREEIRQVNDQVLHPSLEDHTAALIQHAFFAEILPSFEALQAVEVLHDVDFESSRNHFPIPRTDIPPFYEQLLPVLEHVSLDEMVGVKYSPNYNHSHFCIQDILITARKLSRPLQKFSYQGIPWTSDFLLVGNMFGYKPFFSETLRNLVSLSLTGTEHDDGLQPRFGYNKHPCDKQMLDNLMAMLCMATNLRVLELGLRNHSYVNAFYLNLSPLYDIRGPCFSSFRDGNCLYKLTTPTRLIWSNKLDTLSLAGLVCTEEEFQSILSTCSASLRHLTLSNTVIVPTQDDGNKACLVKLIRWMSENLNLETINFQRYFTNGGLQRWTIRPDSSRTCLKSRVENFILQGGDCPLDHVEIPEFWHDVGLKAWPEKWTGIPALLENEKYHGDSSWDMKIIDTDEEEDLIDYNSD